MKKDFLTLLDADKDELLALIERAHTFKSQQLYLDRLKNCVLGLIFEKESTRTRISFEVAMMRLGGQPIYLGRESSQLSRGETYADTARVLSRYMDGIMLRTFSHESIEELAKYATIPVVNGLTDMYHPCQLLADLLTLKENNLALDQKQTKVAYVGDGNNMAHSWMMAAHQLGFSLHVACPEGYFPDENILSFVKKDKNITVSKDPIDAVTDAHVIYTDTWFSMGQDRTEEKLNQFLPFQINKTFIKNAHKNAIVMHCLPAHRGEEITDEVMDGPHSQIFAQAENRLYAQMALLDALIPPKQELK